MPDAVLERRTTDVTTPITGQAWDETKPPRQHGVFVLKGTGDPFEHHERREELMVRQHRERLAQDQRHDDERRQHESLHEQAIHQHREAMKQARGNDVSTHRGRLEAALAAQRFATEGLQAVHAGEKAALKHRHEFEDREHGGPGTRELTPEQRYARSMKEHEGAPAKLGVNTKIGQYRRSAPESLFGDTSMTDTLMDTWNQHVYRGMPGTPGQFEEAKHPRDHGKFASKAGGRAGSDHDRPKSTVQDRQDVERQRMDRRHGQEMVDLLDKHARLTQEHNQRVKEEYAARWGSVPDDFPVHSHPDRPKYDAEKRQLADKHRAEQAALDSRHHAEWAETLGDRNARS